MKKLFLALSMMLLSAQALARCESNEYLDLRQIHASTFKKMSVKDQGNYGLCYSYAATSIVEFFKIKAGMGSSEISSLEAGIASSIKYQNESEVGGEICDVVNTLSQKGSACTDSIIGKESRYQDLSSTFHTQIVTQVFLPYVQQIEQFQSVSAKQFKDRLSLSTGQKIYLKRYDSFYTYLRPLIKARGFSEAEIPSAQSIFFAAQKIHVDNNYSVLGATLVKQITDKVCSIRSIAIPKLSCQKHTGSGEVLISDIDHALESRVPVGISYCSNFLQQKASVGLDAKGRVKPKCGPHASVIIGRKNNSGSCQYLIRNSWGPKAVYQWPTSAGDIWVDESALKRNIFSVHTVQK